MHPLASKQYHDNQYLHLMKEVIKNGVGTENRTDTDTITTFGHQSRYDLSDGSIPLLTSKKMFTRGIITELIWFISGSTDNNILKDQNVNIWTEWEDKNGSIGKGYGRQWRNVEHIAFNGVYQSAGTNDDGSTNFYDVDVTFKAYDQLQQVIDTLRTNPTSRRIIVDAWNVGELNEMQLPPCHMMFQFNTQLLTVDEKVARGIDPSVAKRKLNCQLYQRSADVFLGVPFNIAQYCMLVHMIARIVDMVPGTFVHTVGDAHLYVNHFEQCGVQLARSNDLYPSPILVLSGDQKEIDDFKVEDFTIVGYECHPGIPAPVAV